MPRWPEEQSALSVWIVRAELALTVALAVIVLVYLKRSDPHDAIAFTKPPAATISFADLPAERGNMDDSADAAKGQVLFSQTCTTCHGATGAGLPHAGVNLQQSKFVAASNDLQLVAFLKRGRQAMDTKNTTGVPMPPRGGNPALDDDGLKDLVAFLRQVQREGARAN
jgi:disulfide bond formation protein DsbB